MATAIGSYATAALLKTRAGIVDTTDDALLGSVCDQVNQYIEDETHRILAPITSAAYKFDGDGTRRLRLSRSTGGVWLGGIRAVTTLEFAPYTGAAYETIAATDYFLRGTSNPAAPFDWLVMSDIISGGYGTFPAGYDTVRLTGTAGWSAIPDDITQVALTLAVKLWHRRETGQSDVVGTDEFGRITIPNMVEPIEKSILRKYKYGDDLA